MKILLLDDDEALAEALTLYFESFQHTLVHADRPSAAYPLLASESPDILLLDWMLPEQDGLSVCRDIRASGSDYRDIPILMLTARGDVTDKVIGLEVGADDYLAKPFEPRELLARIGSILRRNRSAARKDAAEPAATKSPVPDAGLFVDRERRRVWLDGDIVDLSTLEYELLLLLSSSPGKKWSRDELSSGLRGTDSELYSRAVDALVSRLRQKLGDDSRTPRFIQTVWGYGYCFPEPDGADA